MRKNGLPFTIEGMATEKYVVQPMLPIALTNDGRGLFDEAWLQTLLQENPELIPSGDIEPMFDRLVPVCMELLTSSGYVDNFMVTPQGGIAVIEVKLWRNPQARREVVAQALDYAKALSQLSFSELERAVKTARKDQSTNLYDLVRDNLDALDEARFIDAVSANLRRGRFLLLVIGDGIREEAADLIEHLQGLMTQQFTFAFIQIRFWQADDGRIVALPTIPFKTEIVERGVLRIEGGSLVETVAPTVNSFDEKEKPRTLTETEFLEQFANGDSILLEKFLTFKISAIGQGIRLTFNKTMSLRGNLSDGHEINFGSVYTFQLFDTTYGNWAAESIGALDLAEEYQKRIAALIIGASVRRTPKRTGWYVVTRDGKSPSFVEFLTEPERLLEILDWYAKALSERVAG